MAIHRRLTCTAKTVAITITAVNDAPAITAPAPVTTAEDTAVVISGLSFADVDSGSANETVTLSAIHGKLTLSTSVMSGVTAGQISGNGSNSVTLGNTSILKTILQGNVGIGTITPTQKLEVNGGVRLSTATAKPICDVTVRGDILEFSGRCRSKRYSRSLC